MKLYRDTIGEIIFWGATIFGLTLYILSAPEGLPWNGSMEMALAWSGYVPNLPEMRHPVWGYFIQVFGSRFVGLSSAAAAVSGGLIGAVVNRYFGWRAASAAAMVWIILPGVWNRAVTGAHGAFYAFGIVLFIWLANAVFLIATRRARATVTKQGAENANAALTGWASMSWRARVNRIAAWTAVGFAALFALVSIFTHDYTIGEAASVYARGMLDEAGERMVILNGVADDQMVWEAERRESGSAARLVEFRNDDAYRTQFVARIRREFPDDPNLWAAAQVSPQAFADLAAGVHSNRLFVMTGQTTDPEKWAARWEVMKAYLSTSDPFLPLMRRAFAFEANILGNRLQKSGQLKAAWELYWKIVNEVDAGNASAFINLSEMLRRGYAADFSNRKRIESFMADLREAFAGDRTTEHAKSLVAAYGPIMPDAERIRSHLEKVAVWAKEMKTRPREMEKELPLELQTLVEWNNEMISEYENGRVAHAAHIARRILTRREWRDLVAAHVVMGAATALEGDYRSSEAFYRTAIEGRKAPPPAVYNDYADTLLHLGRLEDAEVYARLAIDRSKGKDWLYKLTLAEILRDAKKNPGEMKDLLKDIRKHAPESVRPQLDRNFPR